MNTQSIWKNDSGSLEKLCDTLNTSEFIIKNIRDSCYNIDDLQKIASAVESMIESIESDTHLYDALSCKDEANRAIPTLRQLMVQTGEIFV